MYVTRWNPSREAMSLRSAMDRLLDDSFVRPWSTQDSGQRVANLPIDAYTTENEIVVTAAVPGVNPEDVESSKVHVKGFVAKEFCKRPSNFRATPRSALAVVPSAARTFWNSTPCATSTTSS